MNKKKGYVHRSVGFMKRIARMLDKDRKHILHIMKKQKRKMKECSVNNISKAADVSTSDSSKQSISSVNNDWEHWVQLHGKAGAAEVDVKELGKVVGVEFNCDTLNSFNLLSREGRREWRVASVVATGCRSVEGKEAEEGVC